MLQGSWTTQTSEVGLHVPWPEKSECASTLWMVTQCTWISFPYRLIMSEKWILTFKYPQLHNILSQTYDYIMCLTGNDIKETRSSIYWHIIAGSLYTAKWYIVYTNCCTITVVKPVLNTLWCGSVPGTVTKLQIYLNCGSVLGWGNRSLFPSILTRSGAPPQCRYQCVLGALSLEIMKLWHEADLSTVPNAKVRNQWHYVPSWHRQEHNFCCMLQHPARQI